MCCGLKSPRFKLFLEIMAVEPSGPKREKIIQVVLNNVGGILVPTAPWVTVTSAKAALMLSGTHRFWSNICFHPDDLFVTDVPAYFPLTMKLHSAELQQ